MLKEVDAKAWAPEENLQKLLSACLASKPPRISTTALPSAAGSTTGPLDANNQASAANSVIGVQNDILSQASSLPTDPANFPRRKLFYDLRVTLNELMVTMDEKNHVMNNANEELGRNLQRINTILPRLDDEISEEVRFGSSIHWAYAENRASAKALIGGESRSRKEAATGLAIMQNETAARSESRREAVRENKRLKAAQHQQQDSDFDEQRSGTKRVNGKTKRVGEIAAEAGAGLGISTVSPPARKKRTEKSTVGGVAMERTTSGSHIGGTSMSRQVSQQEAPKKRRAPKDAANTGSRKRAQTGNSAANSPLLVSSPLVGNFNKEAHRSSPAPRPQASRVRQNSQNEIARGRPPSSASNRAAANGVSATKTPDLQQVGVITGKSASEIKNTMKESANKSGDRLFEEDTKNGNGEVEVNAVRGGILLERTSSKASHTEKLKREAEDTNSEGGRGRKNSSAAPSPRLSVSGVATSENTSTRPDRRRGASSKTSTPVASTFEEAANSKPNGASGRPPNRPSRQNTLTLVTSLSDAAPAMPAQPVKRSHKKGAGLAAQAAAAAAARAAADKTQDGLADEDGGEGEEEEEPLYCYCQQVSYGEMIACDGADCKREWFHLECAGLDKVPGRNTKWYCDECKERLKKGKGFQGIENPAR